jgi:uncharacterized phage-associated protein
MTKAIDIANFFLKKAIKTGSFLSNLKLQKLVYYSQAWHLGLNKTPIFDEDFEAWVHGPVLPSLYRQFKNFEWRPICLEEEPECRLESGLIDFLEEVAEEYFSCEAYDLERMTHAERPWQLARQGLAPEDRSNNIIQKEWMMDYYSSRE